MLVFDNTSRKSPQIQDQMESIFEGPEIRPNGTVSGKSRGRLRYFRPRHGPRFHAWRTAYGRNTGARKGNLTTNEQAQGKTENYCGGNAAIALGNNRMTESFANYRAVLEYQSARNRVERFFFFGGGSMIFRFTASRLWDRPAEQDPRPEVLISDAQKEFELAETGFISLTMRRAATMPAFFSANSVQSRSYFR